MINFLISYWLTVVPTAVTGLILLGIAKRLRDDKAKKEKALVPVAIRKKNRG